MLACVIAKQESFALDMFDALNTTGEPLTALQTLKPEVVSFENEREGYPGSKSKAAFKEIDKNLDDLDRFQVLKAKQKETRDLVVSWALYTRGEKIGNSLSEQREFLRKIYRKAAHEDAENKNPHPAQVFMQTLASFSLYRRCYWHLDGLEESSAELYDEETAAEVKLLSSLIKDMKTSLALPILFRYWNPNDKGAKVPQFLQALKAVAAFLVLRRAATGRTDGIDNDFREIMAPNGWDLCAGVDNSNTLLPIESLKKALKALLNRKLDFPTRDIHGAGWARVWGSRVIDNPLYSNSQPLARFMILCALCEAEPSDEPGLGSKAGRLYSLWNRDVYKTVEHIAPENRRKNWDKKIYDNSERRHSLGNLVLLPGKEGVTVGGYDWEKKRRLYQAMASPGIKEILSGDKTRVGKKEASSEIDEARDILEDARI